MSQAVILVGGLGTQLGNLTAQTPKPMLDVGGRPFLYWLIEIIRAAGVDDILLLAGFAAPLVQQAFTADSDVRVVVEHEPLGTGGAVRHALPLLQPRFALLNGDSLLDCDLADLANDARGSATLALRRVPDASRYGAVELEPDGRIGRFEGAGAPGPGLINGGVGIIERTVIEAMPEGLSTSIEHGVYPILAREGRLYGREFDGAFIDIGTPDDFARAQTAVPHMAAAALRRAAIG